MQAVKINYEMILKGIEVINKLDTYYAQKKEEVNIAREQHDMYCSCSLCNEVFDMTKYKDIFRDTYWGWFKKRQFNEDELEQIIENRNNFIVEFNVKKHIHLSKFPKWIRKNVYRSPTNSQNIENFDHIEVYQTANKDHVLVVSPYCRDKDDYFYNLGFEKYKPMYGRGATTYIKYIYR